MSLDTLLILSLIVQVALFIGLLTLSLILTRYLRWQAQELAGAGRALEAWFAHSTKLHREAKAQALLVPDVFQWVSAQVKDEAGLVPVNQVARTVPDLQAVELQAPDGRRIVVSPLSARDLRKAQKGGSGRLAEALAQPLLNGKDVVSLERSLVNAGDYFDLEAAQAGALLRIDWSNVHRLWFHINH